MLEEERYLKKEINKFNQSHKKQFTYQIVDGWATLFLDGKSIMNSDIYTVLDKVEELNAET